MVAYNIRKFFLKVKFNGLFFTKGESLYLFRIPGIGVKVVKSNHMNVTIAQRQTIPQPGMSRLRRSWPSACLTLRVVLSASRRMSCSLRSLS